MDSIKKRVGFFTLPGEENHLEDILNNPHCVIITKKEQINSKDSVVHIYLEWEQHE